MLAAICLVKSHNTVLVTTTFRLLSVPAPVVVAGVSLVVGLTASVGCLLVVHPVSSPNVSSEDTSQLWRSGCFESERRVLIFTIC